MKTVRNVSPYGALSLPTLGIAEVKAGEAITVSNAVAGHAPEDRPVVDKDGQPVLDAAGDPVVERLLGAGLLAQVGTWELVEPDADATPEAAVEGSDV